MLNQSVISYKSGIECLESDLSKLKGKQVEDPTCVASISPRRELENAHNTRIEELLKDNDKIESNCQEFH